MSTEQRTDPQMTQPNVRERRGIQLWEVKQAKEQAEYVRDGSDNYAARELAKAVVVVCDALLDLPALRADRETDDDVCLRHRVWQPNCADCLREKAGSGERVSATGADTDSAIKQVQILPSDTATVPPSSPPSACDYRCVEPPGHDGPCRDGRCSPLPPSAPRVERYLIRNRHGAECWLDSRLPRGFPDEWRYELGAPFTAFRLVELRPGEVIREGDDIDWKQATRNLEDEVLKQDAELDRLRAQLAALREQETGEQIPVVPDEGAVGSAERDLRVIASRINADQSDGRIRHLTSWCVARLLEIATELQSLRAGWVESVVVAKYSEPLESTLPMVAVPTDWPIGTRVEVRPFAADSNRGAE